VVLNFSGEGLEFMVPDAMTGTLVLDNLSNLIATAKDRLILRPWEARIYKY
jgi:hypothetical protein